MSYSIVPTLTYIHSHSQKKKQKILYPLRINKPLIESFRRTLFIARLNSGLLRLHSSENRMIDTKKSINEVYKLSLFVLI